MPRRHGWLRDYHQEFDWGLRDAAVEPRPAPVSTPTPSPVNVTVNINLGDMLKQVMSGVKTSKEAIDEVLASAYPGEPEREHLDEGDDLSWVDEVD